VTLKEMEVLLELVSAGGEVVSRDRLLARAEPAVASIGGEARPRRRLARVGFGLMALLVAILAVLFWTARVNYEAVQGELVEQQVP
jgi:hypothetical protein